LIDQICGTWGVDAIRIEAHMLLESAGVDLDPNSAGAVGLLQIIPAVWPELCAAVCRKHGLVNNLESVRRPEINIEIGVRELKWWIQNDCHGSEDGGSCAYFSGHCVPDGSKDDFGTTDETYVQVIRQNMERVRLDRSGHPPTAMKAGDRVVVRDGPLRRRSSPSLQGAILDQLPIGVRVTIIDGPIKADGFNWIKIQSDSNAEGWVASEFCSLV